MTAAMMNARAGLTKVATGDQGLFMRKALFDAVGGFPDMPAHGRRRTIKKASRRREKHGDSHTPCN